MRRDSKRDTKNRLLGSVGEDECGMIRNMYITIYEIDGQSKFDAWDRVLRAGGLGGPWGLRWGGRWEGSSVWGTHVIPMADSCQCMAKTTTIL